MYPSFISVSQPYKQTQRSQPCIAVAADALHIPTKFHPEDLPNQKLHSFLAILLTSFYTA